MNAPGGNVDITARTIGPPLTEALGQSVVVDNRPGGGGNLGASLVARAAPDGYTLLMGSSGPLSINVIVFKDVPYDSARFRTGVRRSRGPAGPGRESEIDTCIGG